jgi:hypothetical protein
LEESSRVSNLFWCVFVFLSLCWKGFNLDLECVLERMRTWKRWETVREKEWRRERIFFAKNKEIFCFQNLIGCIDSVCECLLRSHAPSAPPPLISHHTTIICLACDHIWPVWLNQTKISFFAPPDLLFTPPCSYYLHLLFFLFAFILFHLLHLF